MNYPYEPEKAKEAILYIVSNADRKDKHSVFKTLYFAERKHLAEYGRSITGDRFIAMTYGPVPSRILDSCNETKDTGEPFENAFILKGRNIMKVREAKLDYFSESDLECLDHGIETIRGLNFDERSRISHDAAYNAAPTNGTITPLNMAKAEGADKGALEYIHDMLKVVNL